MSQWDPGYADYHIVHDDPFPIAMGSDPDDYWYDFMREFRLIVNLTDRAGHETVPHAMVMHYSMLDMDEEEYVPEQEQSEHFLWAVHVFASTGPSYWHCAAGLNRSGYMLAAYLHLYRQLTIEDSIALLRKKRSRHVLCNKVFENALLRRYSK